MPIDNRQYWVEDCYATRCFLCSSKFSLIRRKHHCRQCGQVFCGDCLVVASREDKSCKTCDNRRRDSQRNGTYFNSSAGVAAKRKASVAPSSGSATTQSPTTAAGSPGTPTSTTAPSSTTIPPAPPAPQQQQQQQQTMLMNFFNKISGNTNSNNATATNRGGQQQQSGSANRDGRFVSFAPVGGSHQNQHGGNQSASTAPFDLHNYEQYGYEFLATDSDEEYNDAYMDEDTTSIEGAGDTATSVGHPVIVVDPHNAPSAFGESCNRPGNSVHYTSSAIPTMMSPRYANNVVSSPRSFSQGRSGFSQSHGNKSASGSNEFAIGAAANNSTDLNATLGATNGLMSSRSLRSTTADYLCMSARGRPTARRQKGILFTSDGKINLSRVPPHQEPETDLKVLTYGTHEVPLATPKNPMETFLETLSAEAKISLAQKQLKQANMLRQAVPKKRFYTAVPFVTFRTYETSTDSKFYPTSFTKDIMTVDLSVKKLLNQHYDYLVNMCLSQAERRSILREAGELFDEDDESTMQFFAGNGNSDNNKNNLMQRTQSWARRSTNNYTTNAPASSSLPNSNKRPAGVAAAIASGASGNSSVPLRGIAACIVAPDRRVDVLVESLQKRCSTHLRLRVHQLLDEIMTSDPTVLNALTPPTLTSRLLGVPPLNPDGRSPAQPATVSQVSPPPRSPPPAPPTVPTPEVWEEAICDLAWKVIGQTQFIPKHLLPRHYFRSTGSTEALDHSGWRRHIAIIPAEGGDIADTEVIHGVALWQPLTEKIPEGRLLHSMPRVLLLGGAAVGPTPSLVRSDGGLDEYVASYQGWFGKLYERIRIWKPTVILCEGTMHHYLQEAAAKENIKVATLVKRSLLERLERALGARIIEDLAKVTIAEMTECNTNPALNPVGRANELTIEFVNEQPLMIFSGLDRATFSTVMLRGAHIGALNVVKSLLEQAIECAFHLTAVAHFCADFGVVIGPKSELWRLTQANLPVADETCFRSFVDPEEAALLAKALEAEAASATTAVDVPSELRRVLIPALKLKGSFAGNNGNNVDNDDDDGDSGAPPMDFNATAANLLSSGTVLYRKPSMITARSVLTNNTIERDTASAERPSADPIKSSPALMGVAAAGFNIVSHNSAEDADSIDNSSVAESAFERALHLFSGPDVQLELSCSAEKKKQDAAELDLTSIIGGQQQESSNGSGSYSGNTQLAPIGSGGYSRTVGTAVVSINIGVQFPEQVLEAAAALNVKHKNLIRDNIVVNVVTLERVGNTIGGGAANTDVDRHSENPTIFNASGSNGPPGRSGVILPFDDVTSYNLKSGANPLTSVGLHDAHFFDEKEYYHPQALRDAKQDRTSFTYYSPAGGDETVFELLRDAAESSANYTKIYLHESRRIVMRVMHEVPNPGDPIPSIESIYSPVCYYSCSACQRLMKSNGLNFSDDEEYTPYRFCKSVSDGRSVSTHVLHMSVGALFELMFYANPTAQSQATGGGGGAFNTSVSTATAPMTFPVFGAQASSEGLYGIHCGHEMFTEIRPCFEITAKNRRSTALVSFAVESIDVNVIVGPSMFMTRDFRFQKQAAAALIREARRRQRQILRRKRSQLRIASGDNINGASKPKSLTDDYGLVVEADKAVGGSSGSSESSSESDSMSSDDEEDEDEETIAAAAFLEERINTAISSGANSPSPSRPGQRKIAAAVLPSAITHRDRKSITDAFWEELGATAFDLDSLGLVPKYLNHHGFATSDDVADFSEMGFAIGENNVIRPSADGTASFYTGGGMSRSASPNIATGKKSQKRSRMAQSPKYNAEALALRTTLEVRGFDTSHALVLKSRCHRHVIRSHYLTLERKELIQNVMELIQVMSALNHLSFYIVMAMSHSASNSVHKIKSPVSANNSINFAAPSAGSGRNHYSPKSGSTSSTQPLFGLLLITPTMLLQMAHDLQNLEQVANFRKQILDPCVQELVHAFSNAVNMFEYNRANDKLVAAAAAAAAASQQQHSLPASHIHRRVPSVLPSVGPAMQIQFASTQFQPSQPTPPSQQTQPATQARPTTPTPSANPSMAPPRSESFPDASGLVPDSSPVLSTGSIHSQQPAGVADSHNTSVIEAGGAPVTPTSNSLFPPVPLPATISQAPANTNTNNALQSASHSSAAFSRSASYGPDGPPPTNPTAPPSIAHLGFGGGGGSVAGDTTNNLAYRLRRSTTLDAASVAGSPNNLPFGAPNHPPPIPRAPARPLAIVHPSNAGEDTADFGSFSPSAMSPTELSPASLIQLSNATLGQFRSNEIGYSPHYDCHVRLKEPTSLILLALRAAAPHLAASHTFSMLSNQNLKAEVNTKKTKAEAVGAGDKSTQVGTASVARGGEPSVAVPKDHLSVPTGTVDGAGSSNESTAGRTSSNGDGTEADDKTVDLANHDLVGDGTSGANTAAADNKRRHKGGAAAAAASQFGDQGLIDGYYNTDDDGASRSSSTSVSTDTIEVEKDIGDYFSSSSSGGEFEKVARDGDEDEGMLSSGNENRPQQPLTRSGRAVRFLGRSSPSQSPADANDPNGKKSPKHTDNSPKTGSGNNKKTTTSGGDAGNSPNNLPGDQSKLNKSQGHFNANAESSHSALQTRTKSVPRLPTGKDDELAQPSSKPKGRLGMADIEGAGALGEDGHRTMTMAALFRSDMPQTARGPRTSMGQEGQHWQSSVNLAATASAMGGNKERQRSLSPAVTSRGQLREQSKSPTQHRKPTVAEASSPQPQKPHAVAEVTSTPPPTTQQQTHAMSSPTPPATAPSKLTKAPPSLLPTDTTTPKPVPSPTAPNATSQQPRTSGPHLHRNSTVIRSYQEAIDILYGVSQRAKDAPPFSTFTDIININDDSAMREVATSAKALQRQGLVGTTGTGVPSMAAHAAANAGKGVVTAVVGAANMTFQTAMAPLRWAANGLELAAASTGSDIKVKDDTNHSSSTNNTSFKTAHEEDVDEQDEENGLIAARAHSASTTKAAAADEGNSAEASPTAHSPTNIGEAFSASSPMTTEMAKKSTASPNTLSSHTTNATKPYIPAAGPTLAEVRVGSTTLPTLAQRQVTVESLFPLQFAALRYLYADGCPEDVLVSLLRCEDYHPGSGQSHARGKAFYKTSDQRYILKQVKQTELTHFTKLGPNYFSHMAQMFSEQQDVAVEHYAWPSMEAEYSSNAAFGSNLSNENGRRASRAPFATDGRMGPTGIAGSTERINASTIPAKHTIQSLIVKVLGVFSVSVSVPEPKRRSKHRRHHGDQGIGETGMDSTTGLVSAGVPNNSNLSAAPHDHSHRHHSTSVVSLAKDPNATGEVRYFILMENLLMSSRTQIQRAFDLKGSQQRRFANESPRSTFMDENMINRNRAGFFLYVTEDDSSWLKTVFQRDTELLAQSNVMDYSLIAGMERNVDEERYFVPAEEVASSKAMGMRPTLTVRPRHDVEVDRERKARQSERQQRQQWVQQLLTNHKKEGTQPTATTTFVTDSLSAEAVTANASAPPPAAPRSDRSSSQAATVSPTLSMAKSVDDHTLGIQSTSSAFSGQGTSTLLKPVGGSAAASPTAASTQQKTAAAGRIRSESRSPSRRQQFRSVATSLLLTAAAAASGKAPTANAASPALTSATLAASQQQQQANIPPVQFVDDLPGHALLHLGIIDYLHPFDFPKMVENTLKTIFERLRQSNVQLEMDYRNPTIIESFDYKARFERFMGQYFCCVPGKMSMMRKNYEGLIRRQRQMVEHRRMVLQMQQREREVAAATAAAALLAGKHQMSSSVLNSNGSMRGASEATRTRGPSAGQSSQNFNTVHNSCSTHTASSAQIAEEPAQRATPEAIADEEEVHNNLRPTIEESLPEVDLPETRVDIDPTDIKTTEAAEAPENKVSAEDEEIVRNEGFE